MTQVLTLLEEAKNGRVGACNPPSMPVPSSPLSPQSATALFAISIVRLRPSSCACLLVFALLSTIAPQSNDASKRVKMTLSLPLFFRDQAIGVGMLR